MAHYRRLGNPWQGPAEKTRTSYETQSTAVLPVEDKPGAFIFAADRWNQSDFIDSRHIWLPVLWRDGRPYLEWMDEWDLGIFDRDPRAPRAALERRRFLTVAAPYLYSFPSRAREQAVMRLANHDATPARSKLYERTRNAYHEPDLGGSMKRSKLPGRCRPVPDRRTPGRRAFQAGSRLPGSRPGSMPEPRPSRVRRFSPGATIPRTPWGELQFHLYLNAFKNLKTTFMKESGGSSRGHLLEKDAWGWIDVKRLAIDGGADLTRSIRFIQPDDGNTDDQSVISVPLPAPVAPGASIRLNIDFLAKLPRVFARTGFRQNFFLVGQWFPKIGVWEQAGERYATKSGWNCHQFHANSEFYADYGRYDVTITVPSGFVLGATGVVTEKRDDAASKTSTYRFAQEDVHDLRLDGPRPLTSAWSACSLRIRKPAQPR